MKPKILVVEDEQKNLQDVSEFLDGRVKAGVIETVDYASVLDEAVKKMENKYDGIMTDLFFPGGDYWKYVPNGTEVSSTALNQGVPVVLVTSKFHHGDQIEPTYKWSVSRNIPMFDSELMSDEKKPWAQAFFGLMYFVEALKTGQITIEDCRINYPRNLYEEFGWGGVESAYPVYIHKQREELLKNTKDPIVKKVVEKYFQGINI